MYNSKRLGFVFSVIPNLIKTFSKIIKCVLDKIEREVYNIPVNLR